MLFDAKWKQTEVDKSGQVLLSAADYLDQHGWCVGSLESAEGAVCVAGALSRVCGDNISAARRLNRYLGQLAAHWNDSVCQSKEQAVAALRAAAYHK